MKDNIVIIASAFANHLLHNVLFETVNSRQSALRNRVLSGILSIELESQVVKRIREHFHIPHSF